jgi:hypothetical protein
MLRRLALFIPLVLLLAVPAPALATFPGTNGRILFERAPSTLSAGSFYTSLPNGLALQRVYVESASRTMVRPRFSPTGTSLLFDEVVSGGSTTRIVRTSSAGTARTVLQSSGSDPRIGQATWGAAGAVYWVRVQANDTSIIGPAGPVARMYTNVDGASSSEPFAASPDGSRFVYVKEAVAPGEHSSDLWIVNADGTGDHQLTHWGDLAGVSGGAMVELRWGTGGYIYFTAVTRGTSGENGRAPWYRIREDGTGEAVVDADTAGADVDLQVAPDGRWRLITVGNTPSRSDRYGRNRLRVPGTSAVFSPDSHRIAYTRSIRTGTIFGSIPRLEGDIYTMALNGTAQVRVTRTTTANEFAIDGQSIAPR